MHIRDRFADEVEEMNAIMGRPPITQMTYQDIILDNPKDDLRVFTSGSIGDAEMRFYRGHQLIEDTLAVAISALQSAIKDPDNISASLDIAVLATKRVVSGMKSFMKDLAKDDFMDFKPFFDTNPYTGEKGPSGAFSAKVPTLDILLYGQDTPEETLQYLGDNKPYFPTRDHYNAMKVYYDGRGIVPLTTGKARIQSLQVAKQMLLCRKFHKSAVIKHIGANAMGSAEGKHAMAYLDRRILIGVSLCLMACCRSIGQSDRKDV